MHLRSSTPTKLSQKEVHHCSVSHPIKFKLFSFQEGENGLGPNKMSSTILIFFLHYISELVGFTAIFNSKGISKPYHVF